jgi:hypothetical protein
VTFDAVEHVLQLAERAEQALSRAGHPVEGQAHRTKRSHDTASPDRSEFARPKRPLRPEQDVEEALAGVTPVWKADFLVAALLDAGGSVASSAAKQIAAILLTVVIYLVLRRQS